MKAPFLSCKKCNSSEKDNLLNNKFFPINYKENQNLKNSQIDYSNLNDDVLEIIDYPYSSTYQDKPVQININNNNFIQDKFIDEVKEDIIPPKLFKEISYNKNSSNQRNYKVNTLNSSSSCKINNEDSFLNNKVIIRNEISNFSLYGSKSNYTDNNIENKNTYNSNKKISSTNENRINNMTGLKIECPCPDNDIFLFKNDIFDSEVLNKKLKNNTKITKKIMFNLKKNQKINKNGTKFVNRQIFKKKHLFSITSENNKGKTKIVKSKNKINIESLFFNKNKNNNDFIFHLKKSNNHIIEKNKLNENLKNIKINRIKNESKIIEKKITNKQKVMKNKSTLNTQQIFKKDKASYFTVKNKSFISPNEKDNKLLLNRVKKLNKFHKSDNGRNIIQNFIDKKFINKTIFNYRTIETNNKSINFSSKLYINPFNSSEIRNNKKSKILNSIKSKTNNN